MLVLLLSAAIAVFVSFLCSMAEAVLLSLNPIRLETLKKEGSHFAAAWLRMKQNVGRPIAAILILNTVAHTGGATVAGAAFDELYGERWLWLFTTGFTLVVLFGTEILPKVLGVAHSERLAPWIAPPLELATVVLRPGGIAHARDAAFAHGRAGDDAPGVEPAAGGAEAAHGAGARRRRQDRRAGHAGGRRERGDGV